MVLNSIIVVETIIKMLKKIGIKLSVPFCSVKVSHISQTARLDWPVSLCDPAGLSPGMSPAKARPLPLDVTANDVTSRSAETGIHF